MKEKATKINIVCKNKRVITVQILAIILSIVKTLYRNALTVICNALQINFRFENYWNNHRHLNFYQVPVE